MIKILYSKFILIVGTILLLCGYSVTAYSQERVFINTSLSAIGGNRSDGAHQNSYYLYGGLRYQAQDYYLSLNLPLVFNSSGSFTQVGGMYIPNGNNEEGVGEGLHGSGGHGSMTDGGHSMLPQNVGIGDMYMFGSYNILKETRSFPGIFTDGFVKFPTASSSLNIGTGEFDFNLAISARKFVSTLSFYVQVGYLFLGNADEANIENPLTLSLGIGNSFGNGKHLLLLGYDSYSTIVAGFASLKQVSIGYTYLISPTLSYLMIGSVGLNSSTSDYTISAGLSFSI
jgi:hypothetical protein